MISIVEWINKLEKLKIDVSGEEVYLPVGLTYQKLLVGYQIINNFFQESDLFKLAFLLEKKVKFRRNKI